ncbi:MAG: hypothetical protein WC869_01055 [Phycisphaerae bacterium]|jgi:hypothetical protein
MTDKATLTTKFTTFKVLDVSTAHVTQHDTEILKGHVDDAPEVHPQVIMSYEHGFFVSSWHNFTDNPEKFEEQLLDLGHSPSYVNLMRVAFELGVKWVNLDCDAETYDFLPTHEW